MEQIKYFNTALRAEAIKMKNTLGIWTALLFPAFVVFMNFMIYFSRPKLLIGKEVNPWIAISQNSVTIYSILFLPLFIAVITFYVNFNEHKSNAWRQIYTLPIPKGSVYSAKLFVSFLIVCLSMLFFYLLNYFSLTALSSIHPQIPFSKYPFDSIIGITFAKMTAASLGILAVQFLISIKSGNFIYPLGFGLLATFAGAFLIQWENIIYYPYVYPFRAVQDMMKHEYGVLSSYILMSVGVFALFAAAGYYIHSRSRIK